MLLLSPNFIMCWKHNHRPIFMEAWHVSSARDGSVFVLLNSLTPWAQVQQYDNTISQGKRMERGGGTMVG